MPAVITFFVLLSAQRTGALQDSDDANNLTVQTFRDLWVIRIVAVIGFTLLLWDYLLTVADEIAFVWPSPLSAVKVIYLLNRYGTLTLLALVSGHIVGLIWNEEPSFCFVLSLVTNIATLVSFASMRVLVLVRAMALWKHRRLVLMGLLGIFLVYSVICTVLLVWGSIITSVDAFPVAATVKTCIASIPEPGWIIWLPSIVTETALFVTIIWTKRQYSETQLGITIYRDGAVYFVCSMSCSLSNMFSSLLKPNSPLNMLPSTAPLAIFCIAGQRLVVSIRKVHAQRTAPTTSRLDRMIGDLNVVLHDESDADPSNYGRMQQTVIELSPISVSSASRSRSIPTAEMELDVRDCDIETVPR